MKAGSERRGWRGGGCGYGNGIQVLFRWSIRISIMTFLRCDSESSRSIFNPIWFPLLPRWSNNRNKFIVHTTLNSWVPLFFFTYTKVLKAGHEDWGWRRSQLDMSHWVLLYFLVSFQVMLLFPFLLRSHRHQGSGRSRFLGRLNGSPSTPRYQFSMHQHPDLHITIMIMQNL